MSRLDYGYDGRYRLSSVGQTVYDPGAGQTYTETVSYTYDEANRVSSMGLTDGTLTEYAYYEDGSLKDVVYNGKLMARYYYNMRGSRSRLEYFGEDGLSRVSYTDYEYDVLGRLTSIWHKKDDGATIERYQYTHDEGARNKGLRTSLSIARKNANFEISEMLLDHGATE